GGIDNAFPHHTNEIAQSEAYLGHKWCNYWFHVHHLNTSSGKMSKSKGEFLTVSLLKEKGYDPIVYRFFCLQSHYRKSLVFSYENLDNAAGAYAKLIARIARLLSEPAADIDKAAYDELMNGFKAALDNDLNTSLAVTALYDVIKADTNASTKLALITEFDKVLSLDLIGHAKKAEEKNTASEDDIPEEIKALAEQRKEARKAKNFALADELRDKIAELGYVIEETRQGTKITKK
ncbi:MAG: cysteine--tRNA ligase, partial [Oscillospiraceae bacterium]|nr:cysteine--tRNA ligase [Oscillospiraceae bacterium]